MPISKPKIEKAQLNGNSSHDDEEYKVDDPLIIKVKNWLHDQFDLRYNRTTMNIEYRKGNQPYKILEEMVYNDFYLKINLDNIHSKTIPITLIDKIVMSSFTPVYNPIDEYFSDKKWDGKDHIKALSETIQVSNMRVGTKTMKDYWLPLLRRWLIASVGCGLGDRPNQVMLLFVGGQGKGKSTWLNNLCPKGLNKYAFEGHINPSTSDGITANLLSEKFIVNIDDQLDNIFRKDFNDIKSVISCASVTNRKAYARYMKRRPRIANFVGSVNSTDIFSDIENRRYLCFQLEKGKTPIQFNHKVDMDQVWAQAHHLYKQKERSWFDKAEEKIINMINDEFTQSNIELEWLNQLFEPIPESDTEVQYVTASQILTDISRASNLKVNQTKLLISLEKSGFKQVRKRIEGKSYASKSYPVKRLFRYGERGTIIQDEIFKNS